MAAQSIGEVLEILLDEFPDVTVSKIRFLESEGLIEPERSKSGYRQFSTVDVERLKFILTLQRDQFLPLKVIRERLDQWEPGQEIPAAEAPDDLFSSVDAQEDKPVKPTVAEFLASSTGVSMSREELLKAAKIDGAFLTELEKFRIVEPVHPDADLPTYDENAVQVIACAKALKDSGLEIRHQRQLAGAVERWMELARALTAPLEMQRNPESRAMADKTVAELVDDGMRLMAALFKQSAARRS